MKRALRVAIADDEPDMQEYLRDTLTGMGHQVISAVGDGLSLVQACKEAARPRPNGRSGGAAPGPSLDFPAPSRRTPGRMGCIC